MFKLNPKRYAQRMMFVFGTLFICAIGITAGGGLIMESIPHQQLGFWLGLGMAFVGLFTIFWSWLGFAFAAIDYRNA